MIKVSQIKCSINHDDVCIKKAIAKKLNCDISQIIQYKILKKSIDARKKKEIIFQYSLAVSVCDEQRILKRMHHLSDVEKYVEPSYVFPKEGSHKLTYRPIVIGSGPAGLFCAYELALHGYRPIIFERGFDVDTRTKDVQEFWESGSLNTRSNVQFGEGGAGTFSDGKLNTLVKDVSGRNHEVLKLFVRFGANPDILYEQKPHIGTDILIRVIKNIRNEIIALGGEIHFNSQVTDFRIEKNYITGICINHETWINSQVVVLAIGHSARDTFETLLKHHFEMEAKPFAVGFRVVHPQSFINKSQYGMESVKKLGAAPYKVTARAKDGRGVYSFCMCPGGYVVNASSEAGRCAVNGMSYSKRDGECANSAIIVSVSPQDYPQNGPLSGVLFQREMEEKAFLAGNGAIPIQRYGDFKKALTKKGVLPEQTLLYDDYSSLEASFPDFKPAVKGATKITDLTSILSEKLNIAFVQGMQDINQKIRGFASNNCWLCGIESRTSSPVKIIRNEFLESNILGVYPCGEGAGYAGGITSAAMDGLKVAEQIASKYQIIKIKE